MPTSQSFPVIGHGTIQRLLDSALRHPVASYLLIGSRHLGKRTLAERFVRGLLGLDVQDAHWQTHPDVVVVQPLEGKTQISVEQIREVRERISLRPSHASRVVVYVPNADRLNESGTNALLKVVEEPPAGAVFVFVAEDIARIPLTLQSRSVILPFYRVPKTEIMDMLTTRGISISEAERRADAARGLPGRALSDENISTRAADFVHGFMTGHSAGARLARIDELAKSCESEEDSTTAWKEALLESMQLAESYLRQQPHVAGCLGVALIAALRFVGGALSPRLPLEACAARLVDQPDQLLAELQPGHVPQAFSALYFS